MDRLPTCRRPEQHYIYWNFESAIRSRNHYPWDKIPRPFFNLTVTYRLDSDFFEKTFGGFGFEPKENVKQKDLANYCGINITSKSKIAAWFLSNCKTSINREVYVRELQKHILIDVFSKCLDNHKSCPRNTQAECDKILQRDYLLKKEHEGM